MKVCVRVCPLLGPLTVHRVSTQVLAVQDVAGLQAGARGAELGHAVPFART